MYYQFSPFSGQSRTCTVHGPEVEDMRLNRADDLGNGRVPAIPEGTGCRRLFP
jgi:hypothetical protein